MHMTPPISTNPRQFSQMHQQQGSAILLTPAQEQWLAIQRMLAGATLKTRHVAPKGSKARLAVFKVVMSDAFEAGVMALILVNALMLAMVHDGMSQEW